MKRVILDTNIYGRIVANNQAGEIKNSSSLHREIVIYGFDAVRKELRDASDRKLRLALLSIYDRLAVTHMFFTTNSVKELADAYYETYRQLGGKYSKKEMFTDFLIVACASLNELDIVVSEDNKTLLNEKATKSYEIVNKLKKHQMPEFINYESFRRLFS